MLCLSRCHRSRRMETDPKGCQRPGPEHHPSCLVQRSRSPVQRATPRSDRLFPSSFQRIVMPPAPRRHHGLLGSQPRPGPPILCRSSQEWPKDFPESVAGGEMNVLAPSQATAMGKGLLSTIPPHPCPSGPLETSPPNISLPAAWVQASKSPPSTPSPSDPLWDPQIQQHAGGLERVTWPRTWGQEPSRAGELLPGMGRFYLGLCPPSEGAHSLAKQLGTARTGGCTGR